MNRNEAIARLEERSQLWDVLVIGGGATGLGVALDAASRGYRTVAIEQHDFGKGTSSRSTKLIHGGVRYLRQANLKLVRESLQERSRLLANAPHLVSPLSFMVPTYRWWDSIQYAVGLKLYGWLSTSHTLGRCRVHSRTALLQKMQTLRDEGLRGGVEYFDGQFDDAGLLISLARTASEAGATVVNYVQATHIQARQAGRTTVIARDIETGQELPITARSVVNAGGVFADQVRRLDDPTADRILQPSQGAHIVLDASYLPGETALMIPRTDDGRLLFAIPWMKSLLVGTTDTPVDQAELEPRALDEEVEYLIEHAGRYLDRPISHSDVRSVFAGLRPLVRPASSQKTSAISRDHHLEISDQGLITIAGGKWTTYRKMALDAVDQAIQVGDLPRTASATADLRLWGAAPDQPLSAVGFAAAEPRNPDSELMRHSVRLEMARKIEDVLARRSRLLLLDAARAIDLAPTVAHLLATELGRGADWEQREVAQFRELAQAYLPGSSTAPPES